MTVVARGPNDSDDSQQTQLGSSRPGLAIGESRSARETSGEVLLHEDEFRDGVLGGEEGVGGGEGGDVREKEGEEGEGWVGRGEDGEDVVDEDGEEDLARRRTDDEEGLVSVFEKTNEKKRNEDRSPASSPCSPLPTSDAKQL